MAHKLSSNYCFSILTVHTTLKIGSSAELERLSEFYLQNYRLLFKDVKVIIIDHKPIGNESK